MDLQSSIPLFLLLTSYRTPLRILSIDQEDWDLVSKNQKFFLSFTIRSDENEYFIKWRGINKSVDILLLETIVIYDTERSDRRNREYFLYVCYKRKSPLFDFISFFHC